MLSTRTPSVFLLVFCIRLTFLKLFLKYAGWLLTYNRGRVSPECAVLSPVVLVKSNKTPLYIRGSLCSFPGET